MTAALTKLEGQSVDKVHESKDKFLGKVLNLTRSDCIHPDMITQYIFSFF